MFGLFFWKQRQFGGHILPFTHALPYNISLYEAVAFKLILQNLIRQVEVYTKS